MGVSENSVPLNPMVLLIIIPIKWLFQWEYTLFSDKPIYRIAISRHITMNGTKIKHGVQENPTCTDFSPLQPTCWVDFPIYFLYFPVISRRFSILSQLNYIFSFHFSLHPMLGHWLTNFWVRWCCYWERCHHRHGQRVFLGRPKMDWWFFMGD